METRSKRDIAGRSHSRHASISSPASSAQRTDGRISFDSQAHAARASFETRPSIDSDSARFPFESQTQQRFFLPDPTAFSYFEHDPSVTVLDRKASLAGYECYVVEQWATSRAHPTFVVINFTGDQNDNVIGGVLGIPVDESAWSSALRAYFKALHKHHARSQDTPLGFIMTINLAAFPSTLTVIRAPGGDLSKYKVELLVNENLKRLGCSGRIGLNFAQPNPATVAKYHQLYRLSEKVSLNDSVTDLTKLCQSALHLFDVLVVECVDGLLCDLTARAINDWWTAIGTEVYTVDPHDGILGPTTVAALLGCLLGARNRLHALGVSIPKDPFDLDEMKRGISRFQKSQRILRTRRLDRQTLLRLHKVSEKAAFSEGWSVPKAVKSTVAELSGKGGEMIADAVGRREKAGIADVETTDIDTFRELLYGERCKWLWHGKALKRIDVSTVGAATIDARMVFDEKLQTFTWTAVKLPSIPDPAVGHEFRFPFHDRRDRYRQRDSDATRQEHDDRVPTINRHGVKKRATVLLHEGRSSVNRIRDVVHLRGHQSRQSIDETPQTPPRPGSVYAQSPHGARPSPIRAYTSPSVESSPTKLSHWIGQQLKRGETVRSDINRSAIFGHRNNSLVPSTVMSDKTEHADGMKTAKPIGKTFDDDPFDDFENLDQLRSEDMPQHNEHHIHALLRRTLSHDAIRDGSWRSRDGLPRTLSFSLASSSLRGARLTDEPWVLGPEAYTLDQQMAFERAYTQHLQSLRARMAHIQHTEGVWTDSQLDQLDELCTQTLEDLMFLGEARHQPAAKSSELSDRCAAMLREQNEALGEARQEIETLTAKLDYEIANLQSRVEDIELGVADFERGVKEVVDRTDDLERGSHRTGWGCIVS